MGSVMYPIGYSKGYVDGEGSGGSFRCEWGDGIGYGRSLGIDFGNSAGDGKGDGEKNSGDGTGYGNGVEYWGVHGPYGYKFIIYKGI